MYDFHFLDFGSIEDTSLTKLKTEDFWDFSETVGSFAHWISVIVTTSVAFEKLIRKVAKSTPETFFTYERQLCSQRVFALVGNNSPC